MITECCREADVFDAITSRRWPHRVDAELRAHVASCTICADLAEIAAPLAIEQHLAWDEAADLPSADLVYWRAQMRARAEAARKVSMPIGVIQALSGATFAGVSATVLGSAAWWLKSSWATVANWQLQWTMHLPEWSLQMPALDPSSAVVRGALLAAGVCLLLAPFTIYLVSAED